uniref:Putative histone 2B n=1 Tax=Karlodinium veneficum TaxID=407301 RepID=G0WKS9_KARVE|nr:putative histone 2B [Karlodinium veneficum]|mmetsp:Transcript_70549/g.110400  ORF Transcript_70549/g.110400 Transcript_70549/m.110400 type:complete len:141 (+) Transcript_70549:96-518(+)
MAPKGRGRPTTQNSEGAAGAERPQGSKKVKKSSGVKSETYERYIYKLLKNAHPKMGISKQAMAIMNCCVNDAFERVSLEAVKLSRLSKSKVLAPRDIISACRLVLPGELSKHAVAEGSKTLMRYKQFTGKGNRAEEADIK